MEQQTIRLYEEIMRKQCVVLSLYKSAANEKDYYCRVGIITMAEEAEKELNKLIERNSPKK